MSDFHAPAAAISPGPMPASSPKAAQALALKHLYIAWVRFQRRPESMRSFIGYDLLYFPPPYTSKWAKPFGYIRQAASTIAAIRRHKPDVLWFQSPPTFFAHLLVAYRALGGRRLKVVADCHNMGLDPDVPGNFWMKIPGTIPALNSFDVVIAHNEAVGAKAQRLGVRGDRLLVLETRPAPLPVDETAGDPVPQVILVPCSYHDDEPIEMLLEVAARVPDATFKLTGNLARAQSKNYPARAPANVQFTGYLSAEEYTRLLTNCSLVIGLTTGEGIQLSGANEAVGAGRPMVLSDTQLLRSLFGDAALFAANETAPMAAAVHDALSRQGELRQASRTLKDKRERRWRLQAEACLERLVP